VKGLYPRKALIRPTHCLISLPPLLNQSAARNSLIIRYNKEVQKRVAPYNCKFIDTSNSLELDDSGITTFNATSDRIHYNDSSISKYTCEAFNKLLKSPKSVPTRKAEINNENAHILTYPFMRGSPWPQYSTDL